MRRNLQSRRRNSKAVEGTTMPLAAYRSKRAFTETSEPVGQVRRSSRRRIFIVQKHDATRLHYDFRLAVNGALGVLGSTERALDDPCGQAFVRKDGGPSARLCEVRGRDSARPIRRAGTVMVWDLGKYEPLENQPPEEQLARGKIQSKIQIVLQGEKLRGGFTLVQIENRSMNSSR